MKGETVKRTDIPTERQAERTTEEGQTGKQTNRHRQTYCSYNKM